MTMLTLKNELDPDLTDFSRELLSHCSKLLDLELKTAFEGHEASPITCDMFRKWLIHAMHAASIVPELRRAQMERELIDLRELMGANRELSHRDFESALADLDALLEEGTN